MNENRKLKKILGTFLIIIVILFALYVGLYLFFIKSFITIYQIFIIEGNINDVVIPLIKMLFGAPIVGIISLVVGIVGIDMLADY